MEPTSVKRKEIYTYESPWPMYAMSWSTKPEARFRLALGSFVEEYANKVEIVELKDDVGEFVNTHTFDHPYPTTKIMWIPDKNGSMPDLLATTGDYLRIWEVKSNSVEQKCLLNNNKSSEYCAPLTAFDWNETDPNILGTCSIDTTCTIWAMDTQQVKTQLIAHDKEVFDIAFSRGRDVFASVGADGSVRMFDLRSLEHSTIIYESPQLTPLLRLCWNKQDSNYISTIGLDGIDHLIHHHPFIPLASHSLFIYITSPQSLFTSHPQGCKTIILDIRVPSVPVAELGGHHAPVNSMAWAPHSSCHICTAADDSQALIWDISAMPKPIEDPILAYNAEAEINQLQWSSVHLDWISIGYKSKMQILRV